MVQPCVSLQVRGQIVAGGALLAIRRSGTVTAVTTPSDRQALHEQNRRSWNQATKAHNSHKGDQARFFREGGNKLYREERELLGDVAGKRVLHLQCNSGQDSLSLAQLGAVVTGVDISDEAIAFTRKLSADSGVPARFDRADAYDWLEEAARGPERWDVVFCSYGAVCWLSDLTTWAQGLAAVLRPAGRFVMVEFHPLLGMLDEGWLLRWPYFGGGAIPWSEGVGDYVAQSGEGLALTTYETGVVGFRNPEPVYEFAWGTADVIGALLGAGLVIEAFREYPFANGWKGLADMRMDEGRRAWPPEGVPTLPLMYAVAARKPSSAEDQASARRSSA
ncbi:MAG: methyltransferase domain-containing protein [Dehalococcoidia bacterium]|nr:methyltransferase domain-containing protein [Dehalococcoidia bacterium]